MGEKLDFSKLLAWELLLALSGVNDRLEEGDIAEWNRDWVDNPYIDNTFYILSKTEYDEYKKEEDDDFDQFADDRLLLHQRPQAKINQQGGSISLYELTQDLKTAQKELQILDNISPVETSKKITLRNQIDEIQSNITKLSRQKNNTATNLVRIKRLQKQEKDADPKVNKPPQPRAVTAPSITPAPAPALAPAPAPAPAPTPAQAPAPAPAPAPPAPPPAAPLPAALPVPRRPPQPRAVTAPSITPAPPAPAAPASNEKILKAASEHLNKASKKASEHLNKASKKASDQLNKTSNKASDRLKKARTSISKAHNKIRNAKHASGNQFKDRQNINNNLIYLEKAIDDGADEPSANTLRFEDESYKKHAQKTSYINSLETHLKRQNGDLVDIVNEFYDAIDPQTLTYLNKLIATSIPLIDRIKLYIFLASLMPDFSKAFSKFMTNMTLYKEKLYTNELNKNMRGLFYTYKDVLQTKRAQSLIKSKKRTKQLTDSIKRQITPSVVVGSEEEAQKAQK